MNERRVRQFLTQYGWSDNNYRGVSLQRTFKRLEKRIARYDETNNPEDDEAVKGLAYSMAQIAGTLNNLSKSHEIEELKKEVAELKQTLYSARANTIPA